MRRLFRAASATALAAAMLLGSTSVAAADGGGGGDRPERPDREDHDDASYQVTLPGGLSSRPEGVAVDDEDVYVGSVGDGSIFHFEKGDRQAALFLAPGLDGRTSVTGIKVQDGLLYVSGAGTGQVFIYDVESKALVFKSSTGLEAGKSFVNDVDLADDGAAYFTDSFSPYLYRVAKGSNGQWALQRFIDFTGTAFTYVTGFNANGIAIKDGVALIVQSNTGKLFRVHLATKAVTQVDLGTGRVPGGDGLVRKGQRLYVISGGAGVTEVRLRDHATKGEVRGSTGDATFAGPTTAARQGDRLYVVNAQFSAGAGAKLPFWVSNIELP